MKGNNSVANADFTSFARAIFNFYYFFLSTLIYNDGFILLYFFEKTDNLTCINLLLMADPSVIYLSP